MEALLSEFARCVTMRNLGGAGWHQIKHGTSIGTMERFIKELVIIKPFI